MTDIVLKIIKYSDSLSKKNNGIGVKQMLLLYPLETVIESICSQKEILELLNYYDCFEQFVNFLRQLKFEKCDKIIHTLKNDDIEFSKGNREIIQKYSLSQEEMKDIFEALRRNLYIYDKFYLDKIYKVETTLNNSVLLNIGHAKLFHLLGFDFNDMRGAYRNQILHVVPEMRDILEKDYKTMCKDNDVSLLKAVVSIVKREKDILEAVADGKLSSKIFTSPKIKTKNFAFERLGLIESPSGVIFYTPSRSDLIKSDVFILRDFIRDYKLEWIFNGYAHEIEVELAKQVNNQKIITAKNAETLLIEPDDSKRFDGQLVGVSSAVGSMNRSEFDFKVSTFTGSSDVSNLINTDIEFNEEDIKFMALKIISNFPNLDLSNLQNIVNGNSKKNKK